MAYCLFTPASVICGPSAKRKGRKWHYKGANKQYSLKKSFYSLISLIAQDYIDARALIGRELRHISL